MTRVPGTTQLELYNVCTSSLLSSHNSYQTERLVIITGLSLVVLVEKKTKTDSENLVILTRLSVCTQCGWLFLIYLHVDQNTHWKRTTCILVGVLVNLKHSYDSKGVSTYETFWLKLGVYWAKRLSFFISCSVCNPIIASINCLLQ